MGHSVVEVQHENYRPPLCWWKESAEIIFHVLVLRKGKVMKLLSRLWADEAGFIVSSELVLVATVMVIGMLVGMTTVRDQVVQELGDVADAISEIDQSYSFGSITGHTSSTAGMVFNDTEDDCDVDGNDNSGAGNSAQCININVPPDGESGQTG